MIELEKNEVVVAGYYVLQWDKHYAMTNFGKLWIYSVSLGWIRGDL